jgi:hypothetical protein
MVDQNGRLSIRLNPRVAEHFQRLQPDDMSYSEFIEVLLNEHDPETDTPTTGLSEDEHQALAETELAVQRIEETLEHLPDRTAGRTVEKLSNGR